MELLDFTANYAIYGMATATVHVTDYESDALAIGQQITLKITRATKYPVLDPSPSADTVFVGRIRGITPNHSVENGSDVMEIRCVAMAYGLQRCPIVTRALTTGDNAIQHVLEAAISADWVADWASISGEPPIDNIVVNENSVMQAVQRLGQLTGQIWYIQTTGQLRFTQYGGEGSRVLTPSMISGDVQDTYDDIDEMSAIKVRGKWRLLANDSTEIVALVPGVSFTGASGATRDPGNAAYCSITIDTTPYFTAPDEPPEDEAIKKSVVITKDHTGTCSPTYDSGISAVEGHIVEYDKPNLTLRFVTDQEGGFPLNANDKVDVWVKVIVHTVAVEVIENVDTQGFGTGHNVVVDRDGITQMFRRRTGAFAVYDHQTVRLVHETTQDRVEYTYEIPGLVSVLGLRFQEVDNPYADGDEPGEENQVQTIAELVAQMAQKGARRLSAQGPYISPPQLSSTWIVPLIQRGRVSGSVTGAVLEGWSVSYTAASGDAVSRYDFAAGS